MTRFDDWRAEHPDYEADDLHHAVIFTRRPEHAVRHVRGSDIERCTLCGSPVWVAPSSREAERESADTAYICCCCIEAHDADEFERFLSRLPFHTHAFGILGVCECGITRATWRGELGRIGP